MRCNNCQKELPEDSIYCNMCGTKMKVEEPKAEEGTVSKPDPRITVEEISKEKYSQYIKEPEQSPDSQKRRANNSQKMVYATIIVFLMVVVGVFAFAMYSENIPKKLRAEIINAYNARNWDEALDAITRYESLKPLDNELKNLRFGANLFKDDQEEYERAKELYDSHEYREALEFASKVSEKSDWYEEAQKIVRESGAVYMKELLTLAKDNFKNKDYKSAFIHLDEALKVDSQNEELISLREKYKPKYDSQIKQEKIQAEKAAAEAKAKAAAEAKKQGVRIGMTKEEVLASSWGKPSDINKTITTYGTHEQWVYGIGYYLYFEDGILTAIQN